MKFNGEILAGSLLAKGAMSAQAFRDGAQRKKKMSKKPLVERARKLRSKFCGGRTISDVPGARGLG